MELEIMDSDVLERVLTRMTHQILEQNTKYKDLVLVGIYTGGAYLAKRIKKKIESVESVNIDCGAIDINLYRDDWTMLSKTPEIRQTEIPFSIKDRVVILVDDVLFTGRTVRAAMDALMDIGRPTRIELAVLIDRGHRELPIQGDYIGRYIPTEKHECIDVFLSETTGVDRVVKH